MYDGERIICVHSGESINKARKTRDINYKSPKSFGEQQIILQ